MDWQISWPISQGGSVDGSMLAIGPPPSRPLPARQSFVDSLAEVDSIGGGHQTAALLPSSLVANVGPSASQSAWQNHVAKLTEKERDMFLSSKKGDIGGYVAAIEAASEKQGKNSRGIKISEKLKPLINALNMYAPIANTLIQADPSPSAFVLGGITCILSIPSRFLEYQVRIVEMLSNMGNKMDLLSRYEKEIYETDAQVQKSLIDLYGDVLEFCREASKLLYDENGNPRSTLKTFATSLWQPYQSKLGAIAQRFEHNLRVFEASAMFADRRNEKIFRANATQMMMHEYQDNQNMMGTLSFISQRMLIDEKRSQMQESGGREILLRRMREEKRNRILAWIPSISFLSDHHDKLSKRLAGTGQWLLEHPSFQAWKSNKDSTILFVQGRPGCGKSCLAALVIDKLQKESDSSGDKISIAFVYCSSMGAEETTPSRLQGSILKQLCNQVPTPDTVPFVERMYDKNQGDAPSPDQVEEAISAVSRTFMETFIVIDGLDECHRLENDNFDKFCKFSCSLAQATLSPVKVIIFSRPGYLATDQAFRSYPHLVVDSGANEEDIKQFITSVVSGEELHVRKNQPLLKYVEEELLLKAEGMFLWVGLLVQTLKTARTTNEIKAKMKALPRGLPGVYELSLRRILEQKDEFSRERALRILLWVTNAKRALSKEELTEALAIEPGMTELDEDNVVQGDDGITAECGDLIVFRDGNYHLLHSSLRDYLSNLSPHLPDNLGDYRVMQNNADRVLGEACLTYLQLDKFKTSPLRSCLELEDFQRRNPFFKYAASYWGRHVAAASEDGFQDTVRAFVSCDELRELSMQQYHLALADSELYWRISGSTTPLHILSIFNLVKIAKSIPDSPQMKQTYDGLNVSPLDYALFEKSKDMCMWLLQDPYDSPREPNPVTVDWPPVCLAAGNDWVEVIERLISLGYDPEQSTRTRKRTPLHIAAANGCGSALNALLKAKVCVEPVDSQDSTPLFNAAESNNQEFITLLLRAGANVNHRGRQDLTALHLVAVNGDLTAAKELLQHGSEVDSRAGEKKSLTPLHVAAEHNRTEVVRLLLSKGAQIEAKDVSGYTPLLKASSSGSLASLKLLISSGACLDARNNAGTTALHLASSKGHLDVSETLLKARNGLINAVGEDGDLPLHSAIRAKQTETAIFLLKSGSSVAKPNTAGQTALHLAIKENNTDLAFIKELAQQDPLLDLAPRDKWGQTPLHYAAEVGAKDIVSFLVEQGVPGTKDSDNNQPLHLAAWDGRLDLVKLLLTKENVNARGFFGRTPLSSAANRGHLELVDFLLRSGASPNEPDESGTGPLLTALQKRHSRVAELLLDNKADPKAGDKFGGTPLHEVALSGNSKLTKRLLEEGCDGLHKSIWGYTPFSYLVSSNRLELIDLFLQHNYNGTNVSTNQGFTVYHEAASNGNVKMFEKLLEVGKAVGADPGTSDVFGRNAMCFAAGGGHPGLLHHLVELGMSVNGPDKAVKSPIFEAAVYGNVDFVSSLLELGADVDMYCNRNNQTSLIAAAAYRRPKIFQKLLSSGANPLHRDDFGLTALDYAFRAPEVWETLDEAKKAFKPVDLSTRKMILQDTIRTRIASLLKLPQQMTFGEEAERVILMLTLAYALLAFDDDLNHQAALVCFSELGNPSETCSSRSSWSCQICMEGRITGSKYLCTECHDIELCQACHSDYLQGAKLPKSAPPGLRIIETFERDLQPIRRIAGPIINLGARFLDDALHLVDSVNHWIEKKLEAWNEWEKEFNTTQRFKVDSFPGGKFLKLIEKTRQIRKALESKNEDLGGAIREREVHIADIENDGNLKDRADEVSEENPEGDGDPFSEVGESLTQLFRDFRPDREVSHFACSGHDYLEIPSINWTEAKSCNGPHDAHGRVTRECLTELLARYTNDRVHESQTSCTESSRMEMEDLTDFTETQNRAGGSTTHIPVRTTRVSEVGGVLHSNLPPILKPDGSATLQIDASIKTESAYPGNSALETPACDAAIPPLGVSSDECTLDVLDKAADTSTPPGDTTTSVPSSDLVTANNASINIGERAFPKSLRAGSSERITNDIRRIRKLKEDLISLVARYSNSTLSDDNSNEELNEDSETDLLIQYSIMIKVESAFRFAQVILLGEVTERLFPTLVDFFSN